MLGVSNPLGAHFKPVLNPDQTVVEFKQKTVVGDVQYDVGPNQIVLKKDVPALVQSGAIVTPADYEPPVPTE